MAKAWTLAIMESSVTKCRRHGASCWTVRLSRSRSRSTTPSRTPEEREWDNLLERFEMKRIKHQEAYALDGACTNQAEEYFSRSRRAEVGIHHHIAGAYLL